MSPKPNMVSAICSPQGAIELLAGRWAALVIHALAQRTKRGSELLREIAGGVAKDAVLFFNHRAVPFDGDAALHRLRGGATFLVNFDGAQGLLTLALRDLD